MREQIRNPSNYLTGTTVCNRNL